MPYILLVCALLLAGCSDVRVLNDGASGPWRVTISSMEKLNRDWRDFGGEGYIGGFCDRQNHEIRLPHDMPRDFVIATSMHELGHKIERDYPDIWVHLDAMDTPRFPCGSDDLHHALTISKEANK